MLEVISEVSVSKRSYIAAILVTVIKLIERVIFLNKLPIWDRMMCELSIVTGKNQNQVYLCWKLLKPDIPLLIAYI